MEVRVLEAGRRYRLTVDKNTLSLNQKLLREHKYPAYLNMQKPPCWVQVDDELPKINCWHVEWDGPSRFVAPDPHIEGAMMYLETEAELRIWV